MLKKTIMAMLIMIDMMMTVMTIFDMYLGREWMTLMTLMTIFDMYLGREGRQATGQTHLTPALSHLNTVLSPAIGS